MIKFFGNPAGRIIAAQFCVEPTPGTLKKLEWLFDNILLEENENLQGLFIGPRKEMITPWSTNAVEITQNMGIEGIQRIEEYIFSESESPKYDPMLKRVYKTLDQSIFDINKEPEAIKYIDDIASYNQQEGLALNEDEIHYLTKLSEKIGRKLTDSEVFGFSQVNSEHCRHKIFNGTFIIDGVEKEASLFQLIKKTSKKNYNTLVSAYKDNCSFVEGPIVEQFAPEVHGKPAYFQVKDIETVLSLKAETHNFPTTVEPFNGAATGTGGEIRDRLAGGKAGIPLIGTAVYMTSYSRLDEQRAWEKGSTPRKWLYQTPEQILIKASNGASDFGNKFGQPLICGSVLTFEHSEKNKNFGYDKVIMQAGGVGFAKKTDSLKDSPEKGDIVIVMGGDNYRIGMGGGAVSSVATGEYDNSIELNAVQRSNPEMQKRVYNAIRAMSEALENPIISIHDHGAGGHLNSLSELVEEIGGTIFINKLPIGDPTLSYKEIIGNESQERMGLLIKEKDVDNLLEIAKRERAPAYVVGKTTGDMHFSFEDEKNGEKPMDLAIEDMLGNPPKTIITDNYVASDFDELSYSGDNLPEYVEQILLLEAVACKDWLTNKVDRSVTGKCAVQQTCGSLQLPLNDLGVAAIDYQGMQGYATSIGHAPGAGLIDAAAASRLAVAEALTNIVWAPLKDGIKSISLSANWMWPCKNPGEDARLYQAVEALSNFVIQLGINVPTGKDSLSMTQKYPDGKVVYSPGTVIISAAAHVTDVKKVVSPALVNDPETDILYIPFVEQPDYQLGGSSFAQVVNAIGTQCADIKDANYLINCFKSIQALINGSHILAGHDISAGGLITCLLEMTFPDLGTGMAADLSAVKANDMVSLLFSETPGVVIQVKDTEKAAEIIKSNKVIYYTIGSPTKGESVAVKWQNQSHEFDIPLHRDTWFKTSYLLDRNQCGPELALERFRNYKNQPVNFELPQHFTGKASQYGIDLHRREQTGIKAAIIREKGVNGDREMAWSMHLAGFDVKDVHMTDLIAGRETLEDINFIVFVGGFSNSDVLGSAKGWAGAFLYNEKAKEALDKFYARPDTLSLGICNGCQLMIELDLVKQKQGSKIKMAHNDSHKFESAFLTVDIPENDTIMLKTLAGTRLGTWVAHGEGKFEMPGKEQEYNIVAKYSYKQYPGNPNGSDFNTAAVATEDGRHLAMMPHLERAVHPWQWAKYAEGRDGDQVSPWIEAFVNARKWVEGKK